MGHLACYDIRRHLSSLRPMVDELYYDDPLDELYLKIDYTAVKSTMSITVSPLFFLPAHLESRVHRLQEGHPFRCRLVRVRCYAGEGHGETFDFLFPQNYFNVPKVRNGFPSDWLAVNCRSNARYISHYYTEDGPDDVPITSDPDEVDAMLSFMEKGRIDCRISGVRQSAR